MKPRRHVIISIPHYVERGLFAHENNTLRSRGLFPSEPSLLAPISRGQRRELPLKVEIADLKPNEVEDLRRSDHLTAPSMPLALADPVDQTPPNALADAEDAPSTWGLAAVGALESNYEGRGVRVAMLDTGLDLDHPAFAEMADDERILCRNFTNSSPDLLEDVTDESGHGTHCAGILCGANVGDVRIGIAPRIDRLIVAKVLGRGGGETTAIINALQWAATEKKADIISMSLGIDFTTAIDTLVEQQDIPRQQATSIALEDYRDTLRGYRKLVAYLQSLGTLVIAATGNESSHPVYTINVAPPAAVEGVLSVGALERRREGLAVAHFSNTRPDVVAPGVAVRSARAGTEGLISKNGTSMATPHVAGVAALWHENLKEDSEEKPDGSLLRSMLIGNATKEGLEPESHGRQDIGTGLIQAPR